MPHRLRWGLFTITPQEVEKFGKFKEGVEDYPLYGHTDGLTKVEIVLLAKILKYQLPKELDNPITVAIIMGCVSQAWRSCLARQAYLIRKPMVSVASPTVPLPS